MELNKKLKEVLDKLKQLEEKVYQTEISKEFGGMNSKMVCMSDFRYFVYKLRVDLFADSFYYEWF